MAKFDDLTGRRFGMLVVIEFAYKKNGRMYWKCLCDCGNTTIVSRNNLISGQVRSCGCLSHKQAYNARHKMSKTRLYNIWGHMKQRCYNPNNARYKNYGMRGISICDEWRDAPDKFFEWAMSNGYDDTLTIERMDYNGNYCPENCTWIPMAEQSKNRTFCYSINYMGKTQNLQEWCNELNVEYKLVHNRMFKLGWSFERAITEPIHTDIANNFRKGDCNG